MGDALLLSARKLLSQLSTSIVGNPDLIWRVGMEPGLELCLFSRRLLICKVVVVLDMVVSAQTADLQV